MNVKALTTGARSPELSGVDFTPRFIDVRHHGILPEYEQALVKSGARDPSRPLRKNNDALTECSRMAEAGIEAAIVNPLSVAGVHHGNDENARYLTRSTNEGLARFVSAAPDRLGYFATLPLPDVDGARRNQSHLSRGDGEVSEHQMDIGACRRRISIPCDASAAHGRTRDNAHAAIRLRGNRAPVHREDAERRDAPIANIMFGSDWPFIEDDYMKEQSEHLINMGGLPANGFQSIEHGSARRLFPRFARLS